MSQSDPQTTVTSFDIAKAADVVSQCDCAIADYERLGISYSRADLRHREMRREAVEKIKRWASEVQV